jgi:hypothetical protein
MLPKKMVLDEVATPKSFDELMDLLNTTFRVDHEQTTLEALALTPDGTVQTPAGELRVTRDFLESCAAAIGMPLAYAYKLRPELFCGNFAQRQADTTAPITVCKVGDVATGLVIDRKSRYRPAHSGDVLRSIREAHNLEFRRASVSYTGVDVEFVRPGMVVEPVVGDVIEIGIAVTNSECGERHLKATAYSHRLCCTNGAMMTDQVGVARWANDPRMTDAACVRAFQVSVAELGRKLEAVSALYKGAIDQPVPDVALLNLWRRVAYLLPRNRADEILGISEEEHHDLQQVIRDRGPRENAAMTRWNAYEVHNDITHAAHGQTFRIRRGLQEIGGDLLSRAADWHPVVSAN